LRENNNYFKLRSYRKSFEKYTVGEKADTYINLDFEMLKDLAVIDMRLRYTLLLFALDVEHFEKVKLLNVISESSDDGYNIVNMFIDNLKGKEASDEKGRKPYTNLVNEINRNKSSEYCGGIIDKYNGRYPAWAFVEVLPFGEFLSFLKFCADYYNNNELKDEFYLLSDVKRLRNVAAHNNCMIFDLNLKSNLRYKTNYAVNRFISKDVGFNKDTRDRRMSNPAIRDIVTLLYVHWRIVKSDGVRQNQAKRIQSDIERCFRHIDYYKENELIQATFEFLKKVVDKVTGV